MKSALPHVSPRPWLLGNGLKPSEADEVLDSFQPGVALHVYRYSAPHLFLRFHGAGSRKPIFRPNYWADGSALSRAVGRSGQFQGFLTEEEIGRLAKIYYRDITAICHNWQPVLRSDSLWKIQLRGSEVVVGLEGPARPQPTHAAEPARGILASKSRLTGGGIQVYLNPETPFLCTPVDWSHMA
jgi:hypothetical protein